MVVFTDSKKDVKKIFSVQSDWQRADYSALDHNLQKFMKRLYGDKPVYCGRGRVLGRWRYAFFVQNAPSSHFDLLAESNKGDAALPDGVLCVAGSGRGFHGQRGRPWEAREGNIHLALSLSPNKKISHYHGGLPVLSAVSIVQALDAIAGLEGQAQIKWVNDVLIEGAKVAGFLVHAHTIQDRVTTVVLGVGLNVEHTPDVPPDLFVPEVGSILGYLPLSSPVTCRSILERLLELLDKNYGLLLEGQYKKLLDFYRKRSLVVGREVRIFAPIPNDRPTPNVTGTVERIGDNLELWLEGKKTPVREGRLVLIPKKPEASS